MKHIYKILSLTVLVLATGFGAALAQNGHFVGTPVCTDQGTTLQCIGKVAGLDGVVFEITASVAGVTADSVCRNPGGNIAPGQDFTFTARGSTGPRATTRNGHFDFDISTVTPAVPANSCPNPQWTGIVVDVDFAGRTAVLTITEDGVLSDQINVAVR